MTASVCLHGIPYRLLDGFCFLLFVCGMTREQIIAFLILCMSNHNWSHTHRTTVVPTKSDRTVLFCLQLLSKVLNVHST